MCLAVTSRKQNRGSVWCPSYASGQSASPPAHCKKAAAHRWRSFFSVYGNNVWCSRAPSAGPASASLAATCRSNCLTLITTLGKLDPSSSAAVVTDLLHGCRSSPVQPATELLHQLIQSLCTLVAVPGGQSHTKQAIAFLAAEEDGLLAHKRFQRDEVLLVVQQLAVLAKAFLARNGKKQPAGIALPDFHPPGDVFCFIFCPLLPTSLSCDWSMSS